MRRHCLALVSLFALPTSAHAVMQAKPVEWTLDDATFSGVLVYDDANAIKRPGIVMVPNWMGVNDNAIATAKQIAGHDHVVLLADVYGKGVRPKDAAEAKAQVMKAYSDGGTTLRKRVAQAVLTLKEQAETAPLDGNRIGAVGFCFGGSAVLELARTGAPLAGVVSFHAGLETHLLKEGNKVVAPLLVLNGAADASVTDAHIAAFEKEMDAAGADWQFVDFSGARHCFAEPENAGNPPEDNCRYDERAAKRAYLMMDAFFDERFSAP
jgi:dienelactone hydrolase